MKERHNVISYLATLSAIVVLCLAGAAVCLFAKVDSEVNLARIIGGLAFIGSGVTGLIGVIGTFKATQSPTTTQNVTNAETVTAPAGAQAEGASK